MRRRLVTVGLLALLVAIARPGGTEPEEAPLPIVTLDALPLPIPPDELTEPARTSAERVVGRAVFAQRVTGIRFPSREPVYRFLLDHPDFAATVARALRLGGYRLTAAADGYWADDGRGATGEIRVLFTDDHRRLYHLAGRYQRPMLPAIEGEMLLLLEFRHEEDEAGGTLVEQSLIGHVRLDSPIAGAVAEAVGLVARPLVTRTVEQKVRRFFRTVARVSRWAYEEPEQLAAALDGHPDIPVDGTLTAFRAILVGERPPAWADPSLRLVEEPLDGGRP